MTGQPVVRRNDWGTLEVPELGDWTPSRTVSVMIPAWQADRTLPFAKRTARTGRTGVRAGRAAHARGG